MNSGRELRLCTAPVVKDDHVYVVHDSDTVIAVDATTGDREWHTPTDYEIEATPAASSELLFVPTMDGRLLALDRETGETKWDEKIFHKGEILGQPVVTENVVYLVSTVGMIAGYEYTESPDKVCFHGLHEKITAPPAMTSEELYVTTEAGTIYCITFDT